MMNRKHHIFAVLLSGATLLHAPGAYVQPHQPQEAGGELVPSADMEVWLRRLVGKYRVEGGVNQRGCANSPPECSGAKGKVDCIAIGTGPGVQCMLNVSWLDIWPARPSPDGKFLPLVISYLDPSMILFGLDPGRSAINMLLVNNKGLPEGTLGRITGNTATFHSPCVNTPGYEVQSTIAMPGGNASATSPDAVSNDAGSSNESDTPGGGASNPISSEETAAINASSLGSPGSGTGCIHTVRIEARADAKIVYMWTQPYDALLSLIRLPPDDDSAATAR